MNDKRTNLEIIAPTVDEAIQKGLADLGLPREAVEIEVLDEGGKGLFGLGNRQARVRLTVLSDLEHPEIGSAPTETADAPLAENDSPQVEAAEDFSDEE
ncbi:MAG: Jag N-terminal domain-containing protein, partial [Anaerolineales bacterium]|nr:Jag N-terminal domain-containing protein [Anaerolineales bacterium]